MAAVNRVRTSLTGFPGAPGVSTMYFSGATVPTFNIHSFWLAIRAYLPADVIVQVEPSGDIIESTTGALTGTWSGEVSDAVIGTGPNGYAGPVGGLVRWETGVVVDKHRLRGRTFIVPLDGASFGFQGQVLPLVTSLLKSAAGALVTDTSGAMCVWHRPFKGSAAAGGRPARPAHDGAIYAVTGSSVPSTAVVLRSRRD